MTCHVNNWCMFVLILGYFLVYIINKLIINITHESMQIQLLSRPNSYRNKAQRLFNKERKLRVHEAVRAYF